ncbi:phosphoribosylanthranilate isomerase [Zooshikella harenae]|uniref:N-(5'-phosphoribosyl)anthranilate isomerase n=1 Tax=Zooshikella harenae TaxID=2827238 RepID=A0ABS5ZGT2_9GAMM|nr:phosphoribosylanthranilate isomerase [Zooshikella harenae]MBU2712486.1 phosphoribosylanthranilate isomerase [Zooshikella harenae]
MKPRTRIKICGITQPGDAAFAVAAGVDAIGLVFYPKSPRAVSIAQAQVIVSKVPGFVTVTGLFVDASAECVWQHLEAIPLGLLQFHGNESAEFCEQFKRPYIKAVRVQPGMDINAVIGQYKTACGILLDSYQPGVPGGTGTCFDWQAIPNDLGQPLIMAGGLTPENVRQAIQTLHPFAVDVSGGVEISKGVKDHQKILAFVREVASV